MGGSKTIFGKLSKLRVYKNGEEIPDRDFLRIKPVNDGMGEETKENRRNKLNRSIFDGETWIFGRGSATQILPNAIGKAEKDKIS